MSALCSKHPHGNRKQLPQRHGPSPIGCYRSRGIKLPEQRRKDRQAGDEQKQCVESPAWRIPFSAFVLVVGELDTAAEVTDESVIVLGRGHGDGGEKLKGFTFCESFNFSHTFAWRSFKGEARAFAGAACGGGRSTTPQLGTVRGSVLIVGGDRWLLVCKV